MSDIRVGISGWRYAPWRGVFYPAGLQQRLELAYASREFSTIELNGSFYSLQTPERYARWHADTPRGFLFSVKGPRYMTHILRLREIERPLANFLASGIFELKDKLGPILWQFPPSLRFDPALFEAFFKALPHDTDHARALAARHEARIAGRASLAAQPGLPLCHAVEIRHDSFIDPAFTDMLRHYGIALVMADTAGKWPYREDVTADFVYIRLHGDQELYVSGYTDEALDNWARRIKAWARGGEPRGARRIGGQAARRAGGRQVFCYFDNDAKVEAPRNAKALMEKLRLPMRAT
ncbi:hypothetical protein PIGHUM_03595 [Pigmentiphaga humi]|uniref:DUF72 domain-containing protein n=1 Tax=Pigmentiphaga humi TaxID=2478468 RepID=A0A3P4B7C5_9BURK|nr:DUF72 domain-containing protein [Pigmentiphaga humi]VCU71510.1 hypothetical protein PIGHUM_03595 [Pigmentiphaga humi]